MDFPEGWTAEEWGTCTCLTWPGHGSVSICWKRRAFELGITQLTGGATFGPLAYNGRSWKQELMDAAVAALQEVYK